MRFRDAARRAGCTAQNTAESKRTELPKQREEESEEGRKAEGFYRFKALSLRLPAVEVGTLKLKGLLQSP